MDFNILVPGHAFALQVSVSVAEPAHGSPPFDAGVASGLVRVLEPPPHVSEQLDQSPYSPHTQSTASTCENKHINNNIRKLQTYNNTNNPCKLW